MLIFKSELSELITDKWPRTTFSCFQVGGGGGGLSGGVYSSFFFFNTHGHQNRPQTTSKC